MQLYALIIIVVGVLCPLQVLSSRTELSSWKHSQRYCDGGKGFSKWSYFPTL